MELKFIESLTTKIFVMKKLFILPIFLILFFSCSSESEDDMDPLPTNKVTYTETIKEIIDNNCLNCHVDPPVNGASVPLITLQNVSEAVTNRDLIDKVESGYMPLYGDVLTPAQVQALKDWELGGFLQ